MPESSKPPIAETIQPPRNRLWLHWAIWLFLFLVVFSPLFIVLGINVYNRQKADRELQEAIAETDRLDPGWRLEDIEKRRIAPPPEQNAAIYVLEAAALLPDNWTSEPAFAELPEESPQVQLDPSYVEPLRLDLAPLLPALPLAQMTLPLDQGHYVIAWTPDAYSTLVFHTQKVREVAFFLNYLSLVQSHDGDNDDAWQTSLTILSVGRSFGQEPMVISQLVRKFARSMAVASLERCLAQGKVADSMLAEAQRQISKEANEPILYFGIHGERAQLHNFFSCLEVGNVPKQSADFFIKDNSRIQKRVELFLAGNTYKGDHAWALRYMNDVVAACRLPPKVQLKEFIELEERRNQAPPNAKSFLSVLFRIVQASVRTIAHLNCAQTAIAVERFRLANSRWPESLDEVVAAKLLDTIPEDPYDGKPLRYRKTTDGVVVYSIGKDGTYAGNALDAGRTYDPNIIRYEFRLWDEPHRRQPPRPQLKKDDSK